MTKSQIVKNMRLHPVAMTELDKYLTTTIFTSPHSTNFELVQPSSVCWRFDTIDQFLAEYPRSLEALYQRASGLYEIEIVNSYEGLEVFSQVTVRAPDRDTIERIFELIEACRKVSTIVLKTQPDRKAPPLPKPTGKSKQTSSHKTNRRDRKRPCRNTLRPLRPLR